jgi:hypothetical protein
VPTRPTACARSPDRLIHDPHCRTPVTAIRRAEPPVFSGPSARRSSTPRVVFPQFDNRRSDGPRSAVRESGFTRCSRSLHTALGIQDEAARLRACVPCPSSEGLDRSTHTESSLCQGVISK